MTLRLRLTLLITLAVALVLLGSGLGLRLLLRASLLSALDGSLAQSASLLANFVETEDGPGELEPEGEGLPELRSGVSALLLGPDGEVLVRIGDPVDLPLVARPGLRSLGGARVLGEQVGGVTLIVTRDLAAVREELARYDRSFLTLAPLALFAAFGLGYVVAGRALAPIDRLTRAAHDLAERRAWRERLPEPARRDELWRLASATNALLAALAQVIEGERRFAANASHELRTPLTVLRGRLRQALEGATDAATRDRLERADAACEELLQLTERLLLLARTEAGQGLRLRRVALDEVALEAAEGMRPLFARAGRRLELELPAAPLWVDGDPVALATLLRTLLDNARKFAPEGPVRLEVAAVGDRARASVTDRGPGFPAEDLERAFERFYQADVRHRATGSGLGLALARSIARRHGGAVTAANRTGGGARVSLLLPRWAPERATAPLPGSAGGG